MEIKTLKGVNTKEILNAFNAAFFDYFIPFNLSEKQLASKMLADKIDLNFSIGVFDDKQLVAFILHGFDVINNKKVIYNGATGVIPEKRGQKLSRKMYHFIFPILKKQGIDKIQLEVLTKNTAAINSYEKSGFKTIRKLLCYKGESNSSKTNEDITIKSLDNYNWDIMESFWDMQPSWQNSKNVVNDLKDTLVSWGAYINDRLVGYLIFNPNNKRIQQIAVSKNYRQMGIGSTLIAQLEKEYGRAFSVINVEQKSNSLNAFLRSIKLEKKFEQFEMELNLNKLI